MRGERLEILITCDGYRIIVPTAEESRVIDERMGSDPDGFDLDDAWFEGAKSTQELYPGANERAVRQKEALGGGLIELASITLDQATVAWFKAQTGEDGETGGTRWPELAAVTLRDHIKADADREFPSPPAVN